MATYNYTLENFISTPTAEDKKIKIFDQYGTLKYTFDPNLSYFYYKNNFVFIKIENSDDITLDFETNAIAIAALEKLNSAKKVIVAQATSDITYYTKTELNTGQLNNLYYTSAQTDEIVSYLEDAYSSTGHSHYVTGLTDVFVSALTYGEVLAFNGVEWVNSSFTFDMSEVTNNYYSIQQLSSSTVGVDISWYNIIDIPTGATELGLDDVYTKSEVYNTGETYNRSQLDDRYYTKYIIDNDFYTADDLYTSDQTDALFIPYYTSAQTDVLFTSYYTSDQTDANFLSANTNLDFSGDYLSANTTITDLDGYTTTESDANYLSANTQIYTQTAINDLLTDYATTGLTDLFNSHTATTNEDHKIGFSDLVTTAHTHDDRYYTKIELSGGTLDDRYYTKYIIDNDFYTADDLYTSDQTDALFIPYYTSAQTDVLFTSYYTSAQTNSNFLSANTVLYTQDEAESSFYTRAEVDNNFLSASTGALTQSQADLLYIPLVGSTGITGDLIPDLNGEYLLGSETNQWKEIHVSGGTIFIEGVPITVVGGQLVFDGQIMATTASTSDNYSVTSHTHDDRYFTETELVSGGVLDNVYYTKYIIDNDFYTKLDLYTSAQTDALFTPYYTSAQTDTLLENYYTSAQTDANFLSANTTLYTQTQAESSFLSANTSLFTQADADGNYLSANTFYSVIDTNGINNIGGITSTTFYGLLDYSYLTNTSHTHLWSDITNTSHTHDDRYYTKAELSGGTLDERYYTKALIENGFYTKSNLYTSAQTNTILENYFTSDQTVQNFLSANTSYYTQSEVDSNFLSANTSYFTTAETAANFISASTSVYSRTEAEDSFLSANTSYYEQSEVDTLLLGYATGGDLTAHTSLTGTSNPHIIGFDDLSLTSHTHDDRYYTETELNPNPGTSLGSGKLDDRYYTKACIDNGFYTKIEVDNILTATTEDYYTSAQTDALLDTKSNTSHTHALSGLSDIVFSGLIHNDVLSYSAATDTWYNATLAELSIDLSAYYTSAQTDVLLNTKSNTSHTHSEYSLTSHTHDLSAMTNTSHTHIWSDLTTTSHTHSQYVETSTTSLTNYYSKTYIDSNLVSVATLLNYFTSAQTVALFNPYYTSAQTDAILLGYSETGHSHNITGLTDVSISDITFGDVLVYSGGTWVNSAITMDLSDYYTQTEIDVMLSGITTSSGVSSLMSLTDVTISSVVVGNALVYNGSVWVNSAITADLTNYFTTGETAANFISANTTEFSNSAHSHYISGLTDVISGDTVTDGQFLQYSSSLSGWTPASSLGLLGAFVPLSGGTMTGDLIFDFMTGTTAQTHRVLEVTTGGTVVEGDEVINLYITDTSLIDFITTGDTSYWSGRTFVNTGLSAFTIYEGQKYIDENYFYEYFDGILYRSYYANTAHDHNDLYYTQWQLNPSGLTSGVLDSRYMSIDTLSTMTLISLTDVYDMTPGTYDDNFLRYDSVSGWTGYYINLSGIAYKDEVVLTGRTITGLSGLTGGGTLDNDIVITHLTANTSVTANPTQTPTHIVQNINYDNYGHITSYETSDYSSYWVRYISDAQDVDVTDVSDYIEPYLFYDTTTSKWIPTGLTMDRVSGLETELSQYVRRTGEISQSIQGDISINEKLYVGTDLFVAGDTTIDGLSVSSKIIGLNSGGSLSTSDLIGFKIDRQGIPLSQKNDFYIVYDEGSAHLVSGGTLKVGVLDNLKTVLTTIYTPINGAVPFWYKPPGNTGYYENTNSLMWLSASSMLDINGSVSAITYYGDGSNLTGIGDTTTASNGLTEFGHDIQLGGVLSANTDIELGIYNLSIAKSGNITGSQSSVIIGGSGNTILHDRSVILGGYDITTVSGDTAYAPRFESDLPGEGIVLKSPDGTRWKITVDNKGNLTSTQQ